MTPFLLFNLYGPLASWGDVAVGEYRPTESHPSKSAVVGLVAAGLGLERSREDQLRVLFDDYGFGVRINWPGELLRDYHTIQVPPRRRGVTYRTRKQELESDGLYTILSSRDYRTDAWYTIAIWAAVESPTFALADISEALSKPKFSLYLGRKSCVLALPLAPTIVSAATLRMAFDQYTRSSPTWFMDNENLTQSYYWEQLSADIAGMQPTMTLSRRDRPLSRQKWQFTDRNEFFSTINLRDEKP